MIKISVPLPLMFFVFIISSHVDARKQVLPPISANVKVGGYDTLSVPSKYCQNNFQFKEILAGTPAFKVNKKTSGSWFVLQVNLRNTSNILQNVTVRINKAQFEALQWSVTEEGLRDTEFEKTYVNGVTGYPVSIPLGAKKSAQLQVHVGCQGDSAANNCWAYAFPVRSTGIDIVPASSLFGTLILFNPLSAAWTNFICYQLNAVINMSIDVLQSSGTIMASVNTVDFGGAVQTKVNTSTFLQVNGGRPF